MTDYDRENIGEILHGYGTWFTAKLFRVNATSDSNNRRKLFNEFPLEVEVVHQYLTGRLYATEETINTKVY
jgi:hypothetical protein